MSGSLPYPSEFKRMVYSGEIDPSYAAVARRFNVSRAWASKYYNSNDIDIHKMKEEKKIYVPKSECLACVACELSVAEAAKRTGTVPAVYRRSLKKYGLTPKARRDIVRDLHRKEAIDEYLQFCQELGRRASSHDLKTNKKHKLYGRIYRLFGSFMEFLAEIEKKDRHGKARSR
jgi:hypothetical protein